MLTITRYLVTVIVLWYRKGLMIAKYLSMLIIPTVTMDTTTVRYEKYAQISRTAQIPFPYASVIRLIEIVGTTMNPVIKSVIQRLPISMFEGVRKRLTFTMTYNTKALPNTEPNDDKSPMTEVAIAVNLIKGFPDTSSIFKNKQVLYVSLDAIFFAAPKVDEQVTDLNN